MQRKPGSLYKVIEVDYPIYHYFLRDEKSKNDIFIKNVEKNDLFILLRPSVNLDIQGLKYYHSKILLNNIVCYILEHSDIKIIQATK